MKEKYRKLIWGILVIIVFAIALVLRLYPFSGLSSQDPNPVVLVSDSFVYTALAYNIFKGQGYSITGPQDKNPTARPFFNRPPGYPYFMAMVFALFGKSHRFDILRVVCIIQGVLDAFCCILIFFIATTIYPRSPLPAFISALIYSLSPYNLYYTQVVLTESLASFLLAVFALCAVKALDKKGLRWFFYAGLFLGFVILTRAEYLLYALVFVAILWFINRINTKYALKSIVGYLCGVLIVLSPWSIRNYALSKRMIPVSLGAVDMSFYMGTFEKHSAWKGYKAIPDTDFIDQSEKQEFLGIHQSYLKVFMEGNLRDIIALEKRCRVLTWRRICFMPAKVFKNWFSKIPSLWYQFYTPLYRGEPDGRLFALFFLLACCAFIAARGIERMFMALPVSLFAYITIIFIPLYVEPRYIVPLIPLVITLSGIGLAKALNFILGDK
ncbi:MAG: glycosyltransferase family 39 protein [Candidatus Omnitrophica bacterium]|nr:glycosyltransferase family 39 protein [Candidatus Omnitrophota bacterium]